MTVWVICQLGLWLWHRTEGLVSNASIGWTDLPNRWKRVFLHPKTPNLGSARDGKKLTIDLSLYLAAGRKLWEEAIWEKTEEIKKQWGLKMPPLWTNILTLLCVNFLNREVVMENVNSVIVPAIKHLSSSCRNSRPHKSRPCSSPVYINICSPTSCQVFICVNACVKRSCRQWILYSIWLLWSKQYKSEVFRYLMPFLQHQSFQSLKRVVVIACNCPCEQQMIIY